MKPLKTFLKVLHLCLLQPRRQTYERNIYSVDAHFFVIEGNKNKGDVSIQAKLNKKDTGPLTNKNFKCEKNKSVYVS